MGQRPNILLIMTDEHAPMYSSAYGHPLVQSPNMDRLAGEGGTFDAAYCNSPLCLPSRMSFMHSRYQGGGNVNLGQHFRENGWYSARVGKIYHMRVPGDIIAGTHGQDIASSWTERFNSPGKEAHTPGHYACLNLNIFTTAAENRQSTRMPHRMFVTVRYEGDGSDQPDHKSATKAIELLQKHKDKRFFLAVGLVRPHYPMVAPQQFFDPYPWQKMKLPKTVKDDAKDIPKAGLAGTRSETNPIGKFPDNQKRMWTGYYASVAFMDAQVGRILDELDRLGLRESTAVVFTSDHGYHLGEHDMWSKVSIHEESARVPLIVSVPGKSSAVSHSLVELLDLYPTVSKLCGLKIPGNIQGKDISVTLDHPRNSVRDAVLCSGKGRLYREQRWALLDYGRNGELYDMNNDPKQYRNLFSDPEYATVVADLKQKLKTRLAEVQKNDLETKNESR